jgi:ribose/xylose/arabinose/galactoside ABC-type transport system permease subunit
VCEACGSKLFALELRRAMGRNPYYWLQGTAVGQMAPFFFVAVLLLLGLLLGPSPTAVRNLLLSFGLIGMVALGVTFPLMKGQYDFSAGSIAALAACLAIVLSPYGYGFAIAGALALGALVGAANGYMTGRTRISSAMVTIMTGAVALQITAYLTTRLDLTLNSPELLAIGETDVGGIPAILSLFVVVLLVARLLFDKEVFAPVGSAANRVQAATLASSSHIMLAFLVSGTIAGLAGLLIACSSIAVIGPAGQMVWMLTPLTAALIGGGSVMAGTGNLRTATIGAASIALVNWLVTQLRMPIGGPIAEAPFLVIGLLADRWQNMTAYMIAQARRGNLLALPDEMQLPTVVRVWRQASWPVRLAAALGTLALFGCLYVYVAFYVVSRVPEGSAVATEIVGTVQVVHRGMTLKPLTPGEVLRPGDQVITGLASHAFLRFADGSEMRLYQDSEMMVDNIETTQSGGALTELKVNVGGFFAKVRKMVSRQSKFSVATPLLTLGVRGTAFQMQIGREEGEVAVGEGAVSIKRSMPITEVGLTRYVEDERTVEAGRRAEAGATTLVEPLTKQESERLQATEKDLAERSRKQRLESLQTRAPKGLWVFLIVGYLIFLALLRPAPHQYLPDVIAKRADHFTTKHAFTPADSPRAAALAQMHMRAGNVEDARHEIQAIMEHDPNSQYGDWAQRFWVEMNKQERRLGRKS